MSTNSLSWTGQWEHDGFTVIEQVFSRDDTRRIAKELAESLQHANRENASGAPIRSRNGIVYAARNLLDIYPASRTIWDRPPLREALESLLGKECGLVRGLYFDKPPDQSWSLPWHQDKTISVSNNRLPTNYFRNPTLKEGVMHVEAPADLLRQMMTLRIRLDDVTDQNGPLVVLPGSHDDDHAEGSFANESKNARPVLGSAGDVLLMRPLLAHCSGKTAEGCTQHRRILHLEFAAVRELTDGYTWHRFIPINAK